MKLQEFFIEMRMVGYFIDLVLFKIRDIPMPKCLRIKRYRICYDHRAV